METIELIPVSQWVYDLYKVSYWVGEPEKGGRVVKTTHIASSSENHLSTEANENAPSWCDFMTWDVVKEDVGHPRVIGQLYGQNIHESGIVHGMRLASA